MAPLVFVHHAAGAGRTAVDRLAGNSQRAAAPIAAFWRFYDGRWGWLALLAFGALFQSTNSPDVGQSLLSALGCGLVLALLGMWWRRATRGQVFTLDALLPDARQFRSSCAPCAALPV